MIAKELYTSYTNISHMATEVIAKKWGNSLGIILPKSLVKEKNLKVNDKIIVHLIKEADLTPIFGTLKRKMSGQEFKDLVKEGWK